MIVSGFTGSWLTTLVPDMDRANETDMSDLMRELGEFIIGPDDDKGAPNIDLATLGLEKPSDFVALVRRVRYCMLVAEAHVLPAANDDLRRLRRFSSTSRNMSLSLSFTDKPLLSPQRLSSLARWTWC